MPSDNACRFRKIRIGVVCEGPTDAVAIERFLCRSLMEREVQTEFVRLQPDPDGTSEGGWANVHTWLENNQPESRLTAYLGAGLFDGDRSAKTCDLLLLQMDSDVIEAASFKKYMKRFSFMVDEHDDPVARGDVIRSALHTVAKCGLLTIADLRRHALAPVVESTETWCVAAFKQLTDDPERLRGLDLCNEFMTALHLSESRPLRGFANIDKRVDRRDAFWMKQAGGFSRLEAQCYHYSHLVNGIAIVAPTLG